MMDTRYNVYFAGEVLAGQDLAKVRQGIGQLFKANEAMVNKLFNGRMHMVKRDCDKPTALKYKQAMEKVGARPVIKTADPADASAPPQSKPAASPAAAPQPVEPPPAAPPQTATERIAALAGAPDAGISQPAPPSAPAADEDGVTLAPPQSDVLRPEERTVTEARDIDTGTLAVDAAATRLSEPSSAAPAAPDTSHLSMGDAGEEIPTLSADETPLAPDTDDLDLSPEGTDFADCATPEAEAPDLDLSSIVLAPEGSAVLEEEFRRTETATAPDTDHIALKD
ncbi:hypothetical protein [Halioglobus japonicus]|uniref:Uncharacterized protein n=1 Tax=Halioglobus japonicus TaxID=930805 RepID=A0AAP8SNE6_9GAMM|nr:hypothetical protein [Halioglobus japonicus]PLW86444.1 hypothetical protein C0029_08500 [Halioglobus japonicus]